MRKLIPVVIGIFCIIQTGCGSVFAPLTVKVNTQSKAVMGSYIVVSINANKQIDSSIFWTGEALTQPDGTWSHDRAVYHMERTGTNTESITVKSGEEKVTATFSVEVKPALTSVYCSTQKWDNNYISKIRFVIEHNNYAYKATAIKAIKIKYVGFERYNYSGATIVNDNKEPYVYTADNIDLKYNHTVYLEATVPPHKFQDISAWVDCAVFEDGSQWSAEN